jgi:hypothetical protein
MFKESSVLYFLLLKYLHYNASTLEQVGKGMINLVSIAGMMKVAILVVSAMYQPKKVRRDSQTTSQLVRNVSSQKAFAEL